MRIREMRVNHQKQPLGCTCSYPVFSWITEGTRGKRQKQARMRIFLDLEMKREVYDSGWQQEIRSTAFCPNVQLSPRTRYFWKIQVCTEKGEKVSSPLSWFETGKEEELWQGEWLKVETAIQKKFFVPSDLVSARFYLCSREDSEPLVNRKKMTNGYRVSADREEEAFSYMVYNVTSFLEKGKENFLLLQKGDVRGELHMENSLGREIVVATEKSWEPVGCEPFMEQKEKERQDKKQQENIKFPKFPEVLHSYAFALCTWKKYLLYGDEIQLAEQYAQMQKCVEDIQLVDPVLCGNANQGLVSAAVYYASVLCTAKAAKILEIQEDAAYYKKLAREVKQAFQEAYLMETDLSYVQSLTARVLILYWNLAPKKLHKQLLEQVKKELESCNMTIQNEEPDWIYGILENWMYGVVCGLRPTATGSGLKRVILAPKPERRMKSAACTYESAAGTYQVSWKWTNQGILFQIVIPFDAKARFVLPFLGKQIKINGKFCKKAEQSGRLVLHAGAYEVEMKLK